MVPDLPALAARLLSPRRFFAPGSALTFRHVPAETLVWEVFHGRLLDPAHTRQKRTFETWSLYASDEAILSLKRDANVVHVVRSVEGYAWEGYDAGGGVFESRERRKWVRELIATVAIDDALESELESAIFRAVVGTRLPLSPTETPLPAFSFGRVVYGPDDSAPSSADDLLSRWLIPAGDRGTASSRRGCAPQTGTPPPWNR